LLLVVAVVEPILEGSQPMVVVVAVVLVDIAPQQDFQYLGLSRSQ
jgi:hypothetical protein